MGAEHVADQLSADQLAGRRVRQLGPEDHLIRCARAAQPGPGVIPDRAAVKPGAGLGDDHRDNPGSPLVVGHPDHRDLLDLGMRDEHVLDLGRGDVLAAADDRVVGAAGDEQVAVGVEPALVPGVEPALVVEHGPGSEVLAGHLAAAYPELPGLSSRKDRARLAPDLALDTWHEPA